MKYKISFVILITLALFTISCGKKQELKVRAVTSEEIGKEAVCPVIKNTFKVTEDIKALEYMGKTYYFCCPGCDTEFIKEPEKFISPSLTAGRQLPTAEVLYWTCSMHPQFRSAHPGKCPICAMSLIPIYKGEEDKIIVDEKIAKILGIKSAEANVMHLTKTVRLPGKVAYDNDLYLAQQEFISSYNNLQKLSDAAAEQKKRIKEIFDAAKFRLSLLGYLTKDIEELKNAVEPDRNLIFPGEKVWVHADAYEYDLTAVKPGQKVSLTTAAYPGKTFYGVLRFIEPSLNPQTRSAKARIEADNFQNLLKLELYVDIEIKISLGRHLAVPQTSLIDTGTRKLVYIDLGKGRFAMREVVPGLDADGYIRILSGLKAGENVVTDGNFMLDSQSTLTGGQSLLYGGAEEIKSEKDAVLKPKKTEHRH